MKFHRLHKVLPIPKENWKHVIARSTSNLDNPFLHDHHLIKKELNAQLNWLAEDDKKCNYY